MWITLTNMQNKKIAVNMDNVVQLEEFGEGDKRYTGLWTNVAKGDSWLVFQAKENIDRIINLVREHGAG